MLASSLSMPEISLTEDETKELAKAVQNVAQYYPVALDPKTQAWGALIMVAGSLYGSRIIAYYLREKPAQPQQAGNVHPLKMQ